MSESSDGLRLPSDASERACSGGRTGFPGTLFAWFGGARASILKLCPSERSFYAGLGMGVLLTALFGGASAAFAVSYTLHEPVRQLWPVGLFWALALVNIDRLLLLITASRGRLWAMIPRLFISALLGFLIAEPLTLRIFQPEINAQIAITQQQAQTTQLDQIQNSYQPKINTDNNQIATLYNQLASAKNAVTQYQFKARCEAGETDCSTTHLLGYGPYYYRYEREASTAEAHYNAIAPGINTQIQDLKGNVSTLHSQEVTAERNVHAALAGGSGWAARETALDQLTAQHPGMNLTVWAVRAAFVLVDLAPLIVKFLVILFGKQVYDEIAAAVRDRNRVEAHRLTEIARLERNKVTRRADAEDEIDEAVVDAYKEERIAAAHASTQAKGWAHPGGQTGKTRTARIPALSLTRFAQGSKIHERMSAAMAQPLSRMAWIGTALLATLTLTIMLTQRTAHASITGSWLALAGLLAVLALAAYSRGFRHGPAWAQRAAFGAGLLGLAVPAAIIAMNL